MCVVGERHLNIVGMEDKFKTHQAQLRQNDNVRSMNHSFEGPAQLFAGSELCILLRSCSPPSSRWTLCFPPLARLTQR